MREVAKFMKKSKIVVPKKIRDILELNEGDYLEFQIDEGSKIARVTKAEPNRPCEYCNSTGEIEGQPCFICEGSGQVKNFPDPISELRRFIGRNPYGISISIINHERREDILFPRQFPLVVFISSRYPQQVLDIAGEYYTSLMKEYYMTAVSEA